MDERLERPVPVDDAGVPLLPSRESWYVMMGLALVFGWTVRPYPGDSEQDVLADLATLQAQTGAR